jgi:hypothetical protein
MTRITSASRDIAASRVNLDSVHLGEVESDEQVTLGSLIETLDDGRMDSSALTEEVIDVILAATPEQAHAYLRAAVANHIHNVRRARTLLVEKTVDDEIIVGVDPSAARKKLVREGFWIPSCGFVKWLEATAEQHIERAQQQRLRVGTLLQDVERHERAAKDIRDAGVTCLADLEGRKTKKARKVS